SRRGRAAHASPGVRRSSWGPSWCPSAGHRAVHVTVAPSPDPVPWNPNVVLWPEPSVPFHWALVTVVVAPPLDWPFHTCVADPDGRVTVTRHPVRARPAVTVTSATKPPGHAFATR